MAGPLDFCLRTRLEMALVLTLGGSPARTSLHLDALHRQVSALRAQLGAP